MGSKKERKGSDQLGFSLKNIAVSCAGNEDMNSEGTTFMYKTPKELIDEFSCQILIGIDEYFLTILIKSTESLTILKYYMKNNVSLLE